MEQPDIMEPKPGAQLPAGYPPPTVADPTAGGALCGAHRRPAQIQQDVANGNPNPWPYCQKRAGWGTSHTGIGRCRNHGGATANHRRNAMLRYAELHSAAVEVFARAMVDPDCPWPSKIRAAENVEDRAGYPRRVEIDTDEGRARIMERMLEYQREQTNGTDPDEDPDA